MNIKKSLILTLVSSLAIFSNVAKADHGYHGGGHYGGWHGGWVGPAFVGGVVGYELSHPYYPYYPYPAPYYPPIVVSPAQPQVYIEQGQIQSVAPAPAAQPASNFWYHCDNPDGYYPYIKDCPAGWKAVAPTPPSVNH